MPTNEMIERAKARFSATPWSELEVTDFYQLMAKFAQSECDRSPWVAVSDRLPDEDGRYLMTYKFPDNNAGLFVMEVEYFEAGEDPAWWHQPNISDDFEILAWMPLPPPYPSDAAGGG